MSLINIMWNNQDWPTSAWILEHTTLLFYKWLIPILCKRCITQHSQKLYDITGYILGGGGRCGKFKICFVSTCRFLSNKQILLHVQVLKISVILRQSVMILMILLHKHICTPEILDFHFRKNITKHLNEFHEIADRFSQLPMYFMKYHGQQQMEKVLEVMCFPLDSLKTTSCMVVCCFFKVFEAEIFSKVHDCD